MEEINLKNISQKAIRGAFSLTVRRVVLLGLNFITLSVILAKILPVATLGIYFIANSILDFFNYFSDVGLAPSLIRKAKINQDDLKTTFLIQGILATIIIILVWFLAPLFVILFHLEPIALWLIRALGFGFFLAVLKVIPSILLERNLNFGRLAWVDVVESLVFNGTLIYLSFSGLGLISFIWAVLLRSIVGVVTIFVLSPWPISFGFSKSSAKELINFGVPFQLNSLLALLKDRLVALVVAGIVGSTGVGFIGQGQKIAFQPLEVMNIISRVMFPTFSRLQSDRESLKVALEKSLFMTAVFLFPSLFGILAIAPSLVHFLGDAKWGPTLPLIYLFSISAFWASMSTLVTNFLNAIGKVTTTLKLMIMWTSLEWILAPILTIKFGFIGMGMASAIISFTSIIPLIIVKKLIGVNFWTNIWQPLLASLVMSLSVFAFADIIPQELPIILTLIVLGILIYVALIFIICGPKIKSDLQGVINAFSR